MGYWTDGQWEIAINMNSLDTNCGLLLEQQVYNILEQLVYNFDDFAGQPIDNDKSFYQSVTPFVSRVS